MINLRFNIVQEANKPIVRNNRIKILFDTGASTPVWCVGRKRFCRVFQMLLSKNLRICISYFPTDPKYILSGFGRTEQELKKFLKYLNKVEAGDFSA